MKIAVLSGKGGTGKTVISTSLAYKLKYDFYDADIETPNGYRLLMKELENKIIIKDKYPKYGNKDCKCIYNAIKFDEKTKRYVVDQDICENCKYCVVKCNYIEEEIDIAEILIGKTFYGKKILAGNLLPGKKTSGRIVEELFRIYNAENAIIDVAAGIGCQVISALKYADFAIFVLEPSKQSYLGFLQGKKLVEYFRLPYITVINKADLGNINVENKIAEIKFDERIVDRINEGIIAYDLIKDEIDKIAEEIEFYIS